MHRQCVWLGIFACLLILTACGTAFWLDLSKLTSSKKTSQIDTNKPIVVDEKGNLIQKREEYVMRTFAGTSEGGFSGDGGPAQLAKLNLPTGLAFDTIGNLYIADTGNQRIRKITPDGIISTIAGQGSRPQVFKLEDEKRLESLSRGYDAGRPAAQAYLESVEHLAVDELGNIYLADGGGMIKKIDAQNGILSVIVGGGFFGRAGSATNFLFSRIKRLAWKAEEGLYFSEYDSSQIFHLQKGSISTVAGMGIPGFKPADTKAAQTFLNRPTGIAFDKDGTLFFCDTGNQAVRKIDKKGNISFSIGIASEEVSTRPLPNPTDLAIDSTGTLYVVGGVGVYRQSKSENLQIFIGPNGISNFLGDTPGPASVNPVGLAIDKFDRVYVSDKPGHRILMVSKELIE